MFTVLMLIICCIGLTLVLNDKAYKMANTLNISQNAVDYIYRDNMEQFPYNGLTYENNLFVSVNRLMYNDEDITMPLVLSEAAKSSYKISSIVYMVVFIISGGVLSYFIIDRVLGPIDDLSYQMKIKSVDNLSNEIELGNNQDEIYELTRSFNKMTRKLNEAFVMQKRFTNNAAHELRTPLAIMRTRLDVFQKRKNHSIDDYDNLINSMRGQVIRLSDIVNSLLSLTNMEDINLSQKIHLKNLIKTVSNEVYSLAESKNISINITGEDIILKGNYDLIYRVFYNLIENSIKYNLTNGNVDINIVEDETIKVIIKDTGLGIPDDMKEQVFEAFFTVNKSRSRDLGGAGIGLSIVKSIVEKHNGSILITNNNNRGSIFTVEFKKQ